MKITNSSRNDESKDLVFTGSQQLVKAQSYENSRIIDWQKTTQTDHYPLYFTFLVLVIDGFVVEAEMLNGKLETNEVKHTVMKSSYKPVYFPDRMGYLIDVVSKGYFGTYLDKLEEDAGHMSAAIQSDKDRLYAYLQKRPQRGISVVP